MSDPVPTHASSTQSASSAAADASPGTLDKTANGRFFYHRLLDHWTQNDRRPWDLIRLVNIVHRAFWFASGWGPDYEPLRKGSFGLDNMANSIGYALCLATQRGALSGGNDLILSDDSARVLANIRPIDSKEHGNADADADADSNSTYSKAELELYASAVHDGWCDNYRYWSTHEIKPPWRKPFKAIEGEEKARKDACLCEYMKLPEDEKAKDRIIAKAILAWIRCDTKELFEMIS
jgi:hypothetical protein